MNMNEERIDVAVQITELSKALDFSEACAVYGHVLRTAYANELSQKGGVTFKPHK